MKSATLPPLRVTPDLRADVEGVLEKDETLSSFIESALRRQINFRRNQKEFIARGLAARDEARSTGVYFTQEEVMTSLQTILKRAEAKKKR